MFGCDIHEEMPLAHIHGADDIARPERRVRARGLRLQPGTYHLLRHERAYHYYRLVDKNRIEAFSDGVLAIIITIMVLNLTVPATPDISELKSRLPIFLTYALSYLYVGIYWNNHHHLLKTARRARGAVMWANLHLLFWLSLFPFMTGWMGENHFAAAPTAVYGFVLMMAGIAYFILQSTIVADHGHDSKLAEELGKDWKGKLSIVLYAAGIGIAFWHAWISSGIYTIVALFWLIPDKRLERVIHELGE